MGRRSKITSGERLTFGLILALVAVACFSFGQPRVGWFTVLAIGLPYLAFIAPIRCGTPVRRDGSPCRYNGWGLLIGCSYHRLDRLRRLFGRDHDRLRHRPRSAPSRGSRPQFAAMSTGGMPEPAVGTVSFRRKVFDTATFVVTALGTVAGWLALWNPFK